MNHRIARPTVFFLLAGLLSLAALTACSRSVRDGEHNPSTSLSAVEPTVAETNSSRKDESRSETAPGEVSVKALDLFKDGATKAFRTNLASIPQSPPIPDSYSSLDVTYQLESEAVFSSAVMTITAPPGDAVDFASLRILRLDANDMYPDGYVWSDCTILRNRPNYPGVGDAFYPDPTKRSVSCYFDRTSGLPHGAYFTLVSRKAPPRTVAVTKIQFDLEKADVLEGGDGMRYVVTVKNAGPQDVAEVNLDSTFATDVVLSDVRPAAGKCQPARFGSSDSSVVCFLGAMKIGDKTQVEFTAKPGREKPALDSRFNRTWVIRGFSRKSRSDEVVASDVFKFEPLAK